MGDGPGDSRLRHGQRGRALARQAGEEDGGDPHQVREHARSAGEGQRADGQWLTSGTGSRQGHGHVSTLTEFT